MDSSNGETATNSLINQNDKPDPRWPYLRRWSPNSIPISSPSTLPPSKRPQAGLFRPQSSASPTDSEALVDLSPSDKPSAAVSGQAANNTVANDFEQTPSKCSEKEEVNMKSDENRIPFKAPPLQGAWANKLNLGENSASHQICNPGEISKWPSLSETKAICSQKGYRQKSFKPVAVEDNERFPWAAKMNQASRNLYRASEPDYLEDGTPKVTIPQEVLLQGIENQKDYILGQFYRCSPPSGGLIYAVFNKLWGRKCRITIRKLSESTYLFHVPDESSRNWVLQRGLWHVDDCLMFVAPWTPKASLDIPEIKTIPIWLTLKRIPNILYSIPGISHIASCLGAPMATHKPWLDPFSMGEAKILVEVELSKAFPSRIAAEDESGFISMVDVEYGWLPAKCSRCGELGHKVKRCLKLEGSNTVVSKKSSESETKVDLEVEKVTPGQSPSSASVKTNETTKAPTRDQISGCVPPSSVQFQATSSDKCSESVESSPKIAKTHSANPSVFTHVDAQIHRESEKKVEFGLRSNKFASLSYSEGDEPSSESEEEQSASEDEKTMSNDLMVHLEQHILRERPVIPSTKAKEMVWQIVGRGRGNQPGRGNQRGRGKHGGHGNRGGCG